MVSTVAVHLKLLIHATIRSGTPNFWPPGHVIGYEHTFIGTIADFLTALAADQPFHANFEDALAVQKVLAASQEFSTRRSVSVRFSFQLPTSRRAEPVERRDSASSPALMALK